VEHFVNPSILCYLCWYVCNFGVKYSEGRCQTSLTPSLFIEVPKPGQTSDCFILFK